MDVIEGKKYRWLISIAWRASLPVGELVTVVKVTARTVTYEKHDGELEKASLREFREYFEDAPGPEELMRFRQIFRLLRLTSLSFSEANALTEEQRTRAIQLFETLEKAKKECKEFIDLIREKTHGN